MTALVVMVLFVMLKVFTIWVVPVFASAVAVGRATTHVHGMMARWARHQVIGRDAHEHCGNHLDAAAALLELMLPFSHVLALFCEFDAEKILVTLAFFTSDTMLSRGDAVYEGGLSVGIERALLNYRLLRDAILRVATLRIEVVLDLRVDQPRIVFVAHHFLINYKDQTNLFDLFFLLGKKASDLIYAINIYLP